MLGLGLRQRRWGVQGPNTELINMQLEPRGRGELAGRAAFCKSQLSSPHLTPRQPSNPTPVDVLPWASGHSAPQRQSNTGGFRIQWWRTRR
jgi:hypothetical protein